MEKISVCIASYNGEKYIYEQINSILVQLKEGDELIISDDNSKDDTVNLVKMIDDPRIKLFYNNEKGYTSNFENALKQVTGNIIFLSDQDDIWLPNKVEVCLKELKTNDLVVSDCKIIDAKNIILSDSYYQLRNVKDSFLGNMIKFSYLGCCLAFRAEILDKALPFPSNRQLCTHDNWLFLVGSCFFRHKVINDKLIYYRRHDGNISTGGLNSTTSIWFKIKYRIYLSYNLLIRFIVNKK